MKLRIKEVTTVKRRCFNNNLNLSSDTKKKSSKKASDSSDSETNNDDQDMNLLDLTDSDDVDYCEPMDNENIKDL